MALKKLDFVMDKISSYHSDKSNNVPPQESTGRKRLNDLNGREWVKRTKSVWIETYDRQQILDIKFAMQSGVLLSEAPPRDNLKKNHPATFSETDVAKLIRFFTKSGQTVLDPFLGSGSSAVASISEGRNFIGIELYPEWLSLAKTRISNTQNPNRVSSKVCCGDSLKVMKKLDAESIDFIVTSPPYWGILGKQDHKAKGERIAKGLATEYGSKKADLGTTVNYQEFMEMIIKHFEEYYRLLRKKQYAAVIVSDFRHGKEYYMFHAHIAAAMQRAGFIIQGLIVLVQDNKKLYPYGYPTAYVPNISNQFIVIARKLA